MNWKTGSPNWGPGEHGNELGGSKKGSEFLGWLSDYQFLKKDSAPQS